MSSSFEHTHLGAYLVGTFAVACLFSDSAQVSATGALWEVRVEREHCLVTKMFRLTLSMASFMNVVLAGLACHAAPSNRNSNPHLSSVGLH
jgi:hypothetical protein